MNKGDLLRDVRKEWGKLSPEQKAHLAELARQYRVQRRHRHRYAAMAGLLVGLTIHAMIPEGDLAAFLAVLGWYYSTVILTFVS